LTAHGTRKALEKTAKRIVEIENGYRMEFDIVMEKDCRIVAL